MNYLGNDDNDPYRGTDDSIFASTNQNQLAGAGGFQGGQSAIAKPDIRPPVPDQAPGGVMPRSWLAQRQDALGIADPWATTGAGTAGGMPASTDPSQGTGNASESIAGPTIGAEGLTPARAAAARGWGASSADAATTDTAAPAAGADAATTASAAGGASALPWVGVIASALANRQRENMMRNQAAANITAQFGRSQGNFPQYGYQAELQNQNINNAMGGPGLSGASKLMAPLGVTGLGLGYLMNRYRST